MPSKDKIVIRNKLGVQEENPVAKVDIRANNNCIPALKMGPNNTHGFGFYELSSGNLLVKSRDGTNGEHNALFIGRGGGPVMINNLIRNKDRNVREDRFKTAEITGQPACNNV